MKSRYRNVAHFRIQLGAKATVPVVAGATVEENAAPVAQPEPQQAAPIPQASAPVSGGATVGQQLLAKSAAVQAARTAQQQSTPGLPFHPGAEIPH